MEVDFLPGRSGVRDYGPGRYTANLIKSLEAMGVAGKTITYRLPYQFPTSRVWFVPACYAAVARLKRRKGSVKHITTQEQAHVLGLVNLKPCVVTCHDVIPLILPEENASAETRAWIRMCYRGLMKADRIITDSFNSRADIVKYLGYPESKIDVVYLGVDSNVYKRRAIDAAGLAAYGIGPDERYILYVGNEHPRKNLERLIKAFALLKPKAPRLKLLKVGPPYWKDSRDRVHRLVTELGLGNDLKFTPYLTEEQLSAVYSRAEMFVFPSLYEGFGNSPLEAMACGTPVVTSNTSSLGEVYGKSALTVDPYNVQAIADAMYQVLADDRLRRDMVSKGLAMARRLSWEKMAAETLKVYEALA